jgi:hypothetical protein
MDALYEGSALAVLVVLLFLRDWRATFIAAALPLSAFVRYLQFFLPVAVLLDACFPGGIAEITKSVPILGAIAKLTFPLGWFAVAGPHRSNRARLSNRKRAHPAFWMRRDAFAGQQLSPTYDRSPN